MRLATTMIAALLCAAPATAIASVPSPTQSSAPCVVACPEGDLLYTVVVRDIASNPVPGSAVFIDFGLAECFVHCNGDGAGYTWDAPQRRAIAFTNAAGSVSFGLRGSGSCNGNDVRIYADGVLLANRPFAGTDNNSDGIVDAWEVGAVTGSLGQSVPGMDFDCDGTVTNADLGTIQAHLGHQCDLPTPTRPRSWGSIKLRYR